MWRKPERGSSISNVEWAECKVQEFSLTGRIYKGIKTHIHIISNKLLKHQMLRTKSRISFLLVPTLPHPQMSANWSTQCLSLVSLIHSAFPDQGPCFVTEEPHTHLHWQEGSWPPSSSLWSFARTLTAVPQGWRSWWSNLLLSWNQPIFTHSFLQHACRSIGKWLEE